MCTSSGAQLPGTSPPPSSSQNLGCKMNGSDLSESFSSCAARSWHITSTHSNFQPRMLLFCAAQIRLMMARRRPFNVNARQPHGPCWPHIAGCVPHASRFQVDAGAATGPLPSLEETHGRENPFVCLLINSNQGQGGFPQAWSRRCCRPWCGLTSSSPPCAAALRAVRGGDCCDCTAWRCGACCRADLLLVKRFVSAEMQAGE